VRNSWTRSLQLGDLGRERLLAVNGLQEKTQGVCGYEGEELYRRRKRGGQSLEQRRRKGKKLGHPESCAPIYEHRVSPAGLFHFLNEQISHPIVHLRIPLMRRQLGAEILQMIGVHCAG